MSRRIDKTTMLFLENAGYGKGTNYTTELVASLMLQYADTEVNDVKTEKESECTLHSVINWVAVSNRLPEESKQVIVYTKQGWTRTVGFSTKDNKFWHNSYYDVLYWSELPKPPCL